MNLQAVIPEAKERFIKEEERNSRRERELFAYNEELRSQHKELQEMASQHLQMWKISKEQRAQISDSYHHLQVEAIVNMEQQRDAWRKQSDKTTPQLLKNNEQSIALVTAKAKDTEANCELLLSKCEEDAKAAREELEFYRAQISIDETRIKILINKHR